mgnify:CR=1 FL=1
MSKMKLSGGGPSYNHFSLKFDCQRTFNFYGERGTTGSADDYAWIGRPGLQFFGEVIGNIGDGNRCLFRTAQGRCFAVMGNVLAELSEDGTATARGYLGTTQGQVRMAENGVVVMIVDGSAGYFYNLTTNSLTLITDPDFFQNCSSLVFLNGYFVFNRTDSGEFGWTDLYATDPSNCIDGYQSAQAELNPDNIAGLSFFGNNLFIFGTNTYQVFNVTDNPNAPFYPTGGAFFEIGCGSGATIASGFDGIFWLGEDKNGHGQIYQTTGFSYKIVSTPVISRRISSYARRDDAEAFVMALNGHQFYVINFPTANETFVYDSTTGVWVEWTSANAWGQHQMFRGRNCVYFANKILVGDAMGAKIYWMNPDKYDDDYGPIIGERILPHLNPGTDRMFFNEIELIAENGVGIEDTRSASDIANMVPEPNGVTPYVMMSYSNDAGRTWSGEIWKSLGKIGEYKARTRWTQLGAAIDRVFKFKITDPVKRVFISFLIDIR